MNWVIKGLLSQLGLTKMPTMGLFDVKGPQISHLLSHSKRKVIILGMIINNIVYFFLASYD